MSDLADVMNTLLLTFRSVPVVIQALWVIVPPVFVLGVIALRIWSRNSRKTENDTKGEIIFSTHRNSDGTYTTYRHHGQTMRPVSIPPLVDEHHKEATMLRLVKYVEERNEDIDAEK